VPNAPREQAGLLTQNPSPEVHEGVQRLYQDMRALIDDGTDMDRIGIAVSGGPDSMALLALAMCCFPGRVEAATVDHGLRAASTQEAEMVAQLCAANAIPHQILSPLQPITGSVQSAARVARYALLEQWRTRQGIDWVLSAHHADDQAETVLMRLNRASGVTGLSGIRARNGHVLRPLLGWRRAELAHIVAALELPHVQDPSNVDPRFDRAALRARLAETDWLDPLALAGSAAALGQADAALEWMVREIAGRHISQTRDGTIILDRTDLPREVLRRLVLHMLTLAEHKMLVPRGSTLDQALVQLCCGRKTMIGNWILEGGKSWTIRPAPARRTG
jgi:tRNA(Ile)-lysidine synthase